MKRTLRNRDTIKKPVKYTPKIDKEELRDDLSVDEDWDDDTKYSLIDKIIIKKQKDGYTGKNEKYKFDDFIAKDTDSVSVDTDIEDECSLTSVSDSDSDYDNTEVINDRKLRSNIRKPFKFQDEDNISLIKKAKIIEY